MRLENMQTMQGLGGERQEGWHLDMPALMRTPMAKPLGGLRSQSPSCPWQQPRTPLRTSGMMVREGCPHHFLGG